MLTLRVEAKQQVMQIVDSRNDIISHKGHMGFHRIKRIPRSIWLLELIEFSLVLTLTVIANTALMFVSCHCPLRVEYADLGAVRRDYPPPSWSMAEQAPRSMECVLLRSKRKSNSWLEWCG